MSHSSRTLVVIVLMSMIGAGGCSNEATSEEQQDEEILAATTDEHLRGGPGVDTGDEGEESGTELSLNDTYDQVRNGIRLVLTYSASRNSFDGTVENTTNEPVGRVRVEVHLSNGLELGPTTPVDLVAGAQEEVTLPATNREFDGWTAHAEVGEGEHGHGEGEGEHGDRDGEGEHGDREDRGEHDGDH